MITRIKNTVPWTYVVSHLKGEVYPLYLIFGNVNGYFEENIVNKYLMVVPTNENKEIIKNRTNYGVKLEI